MITIFLPTQDHIPIEIEEEIAIVKGKGIEIVIGEEVVLPTEIHDPVMSTLEISGILVGATDVVPIKKMEEIIDMPILTVTESESEIAKLILEMIVGRINLETIAGKRAETITEWVVVDGRTIEREVEQTLKSTGQFPLPEMSDWRWSYLVVAILALTLVNMRISQLRLLGITYLHTSHL